MLRAWFGFILVGMLWFSDLVVVARESYPGRSCRPPPRQAGVLAVHPESGTRRGSLTLGLDECSSSCAAHNPLRETALAEQRAYQPMTPRRYGRRTSRERTSRDEEPRRASLGRRGNVSLLRPVGSLPFHVLSHQIGTTFASSGFTGFPEPVLKFPEVARLESTGS